MLAPSSAFRMTQASVLPSLFSCSQGVSVVRVHLHAKGLPGRKQLQQQRKFAPRVIARQARAVAPDELGQGFAQPVRLSNWGIALISSASPVRSSGMSRR